MGNKRVSLYIELDELASSHAKPYYLCCFSGRASRSSQNKSALIKLRLLFPLCLACSFFPSDKTALWGSPAYHSMTRTALAIIDLQEDFLPPNGSLAIAGGRDIIPTINSLLDVKKYPWDAVVATQDWHPSNHCSFASQHGLAPFSQKSFTRPDGAIDAETGKPVEKVFTVWPDHCVQGSFGASLEQRFADKFDALTVPTATVKKGYLQDREYYLCLCDCWKMHRTESEEFLRLQNVTRVVFVGLAYDYCVLNSAVDCADCGFDTYVVSLCCRSVDPNSVEASEATYKGAGVCILPTVEALDALLAGD